MPEPQPTSDPVSMSSGASNTSIKKFLESCVDGVTQITPDTPCAICLEPDSSRPRLKLPLCGHVFHRGCITQWLYSHRRNNTCPCCRKVLFSPDLGSGGSRVSDNTRSVSVRPVGALMLSEPGAAQSVRGRNVQARQQSSEARQTLPARGSSRQGVAPAQASGLAQPRLNPTPAGETRPTSLPLPNSLREQMSAALARQSEASVVDRTIGEGFSDSFRVCSTLMQIGHLLELPRVCKRLEGELRRTTEGVGQLREIQASDISTLRSDFDKLRADSNVITIMLARTQPALLSPAELSQIPLHNRLNILQDKCDDLEANVRGLEQTLRKRRRSASPQDSPATRVRTQQSYTAGRRTLPQPRRITRASAKTTQTIDLEDSA